MNITIRQEQLVDYPQTEQVVKKAFANAIQSDQTEHQLVARIRKSQSFIQKLSLVAFNEDNHSIVGHILLYKIKILNEEMTIESLALAPASVLPSYQHQGIGKRLVLTALKQAKELGYHSVIVLGHPDYYPKFGFKRASNWGIKAPYEVPDGALMAIELQNNALLEATGVVEYPKAFFG